MGGGGTIEYEVEREWKPYPPAMRFIGTNALVTGAGRGFGSVIALGLAREGANVIVTYNTSKQGAEDIAGQVRSMGRKSMTVKVDITKWEAVRSMAETVWEQFGPIDVLINNAGETAKKQMSWRDITEEWIDETLDVDIKGTLFMTHEVGKRMFDRKSGAIVNVASHVIAFGAARAPQYSAGKQGVVGLTKSYAVALAPWVRVNAACPGWMDTELLRKRPDFTPEKRRWIIMHTPLRRIPKPEEVVPLILFLASNDSIHMTGNIVIADGGFTMPGA